MREPCVPRQVEQQLVGAPNPLVGDDVLVEPIARDDVVADVVSEVVIGHDEALLAAVDEPLGERELREVVVAA